MHLRQRSALAIAAAVALTLTLTACGTTATVVRTVTVTQPTAADTLSGLVAEQTSRPASPAAAKSTPTANGFTRCDTNITAKTTTTSCPFAQNVFYAYWQSDNSPSIQAYSPATTVTYRLRCEDTRDLIVCTAGDGAVVKFSAASVDRYTDANARAYPRSHDLGPSSSTPATQTPPVDPAPTIAPPPPPAPANDNFCTAHDCIPNFDNGRGSVVQCEDGSFSQSGGIQGACSHHGGVR